METKPQNTHTHTHTHTQNIMNNVEKLTTKKERKKD